MKFKIFETKLNKCCKVNEMITKFKLKIEELGRQIKGKYGIIKEKVKEFFKYMDKKLNSKGEK